MLIRKATNEDIFDLLVLAREFSKEAPKAYKWDKDKTEDLLVNALSNPNLTLLVSEVDGEITGGLLGAVTEMYMSHTKIATELAWFVSSPKRDYRAGMRLLDAFEEWAKDNDCDLLIMADIQGLSDLGKLYKRRGFELTECSYSRRLK